MAKCLACMYKFCSFIKATITRLLFILHASTLIFIIFVAEVVDESTDFWHKWIKWFKLYLTCPILLLFLEGIITCCFKKNHDWKWFCPSIFLYLCSVVPAIWLIEWQKISIYQSIYQSECQLYKMSGNNTNSFNDTTESEMISEYSEEDLLADYDYSGKITTICFAVTQGIRVITFQELLLMLILIIGRWLLPKGHLTRDQLSQLLLSYIGITADITEMFNSLQVYKMAQHLKFVNWTLGIWTLSLIQFVIVLTSTNSNKSRLSTDSVTHQENVQTEVNCCNIEVCKITLSIILQDGPFFIFRTILICYYEIITHTNIFFTCKNILVLIIQFDRLYVIFTKSKMNKRDKKRSDVNMSNINNISQYDVWENVKMKNLEEYNKKRHTSI